MKTVIYKLFTLILCASFIVEAPNKVWAQTTPEAAPLIPDQKSTTLKAPEAEPSATPEQLSLDNHYPKLLDEEALEKDEAEQKGVTNPLWYLIANIAVRLGYNLSKKPQVQVAAKTGANYLLEKGVRVYNQRPMGVFGMRRPPGPPTKGTIIAAVGTALAVGAMVVLSHKKLENETVSAADKISEAYFRRLWTGYLQDPIDTPLIRSRLNEAVKLVNSKLGEYALKRGHKNQAVIYPHQVFLSEIPQNFVTYKKDDKGEKKLATIEISADVLMVRDATNPDPEKYKDSVVVAMARAIFTALAATPDFRPEADKIFDELNGQYRKWYERQEDVGYVYNETMASQVFADRMLGIDAFGGSQNQLRLKRAIKFVNTKLAKMKQPLIDLKNVKFGYSSRSLKKDGDIILNSDPLFTGATKNWKKFIEGQLREDTKMLTRNVLTDPITLAIAFEIALVLAQNDLKGYTKELFEAAKAKKPLGTLQKIWQLLTVPNPLYWKKEPPHSERYRLPTYNEIVLMTANIILELPPTFLGFSPSTTKTPQQEETPHLTLMTPEEFLAEEYNTRYVSKKRLDKARLMVDVKYLDILDLARRRMSPILTGTSDKVYAVKCGEGSIVEGEKGTDAIKSLFARPESITPCISTIDENEKKKFTSYGLMLNSDASLEYLQKLEAETAQERKNYLMKKVFNEKQKNYARKSENRKSIEIKSAFISEAVAFALESAIYSKLKWAWIARLGRFSKHEKKIKGVGKVFVGLGTGIFTFIANEKILDGVPVLDGNIPGFSVYVPFMDLHIPSTDKVMRLNRDPKKGINITDKENLYDGLRALMAYVQDAQNKGEAVNIDEIKWNLKKTIFFSGSEGEKFLNTIAKTAEKIVEDAEKTEREDELPGRSSPDGLPNPGPTP